MKRILAAICAVSCLALTGCHDKLNDLLYGSSEATDSSSGGDNSGGESVDLTPIKGEITTADALEDIGILGRLTMPSDFVITLKDSSESAGSTSVTMEMHLTDALSLASFSDFSVSCGDFRIDIPDFDMLTNGTSLYLSENAMSRSMTLYAQMALLSTMLDENAKPGDKSDAIARSKELDEAMEKLIAASDDGEYIKLSAAEASAVPAILMTPVSSNMVAGFFGNDISVVKRLFEGKTYEYCYTDDGGYHVFEVKADKAKEFFETLLTLEDPDILGLVMVDTYDDPLWSSITAETWILYADLVQKYIDSYKDHWQACIDAIGEGFEYSYKLTSRIKSDKDIYLKLEMHTVENGASIDRSIEIKSLDPIGEISLPDGSKIKTSEQWEAEMKPLLDEYLGEFEELAEDNSESGATTT